MSNKEEGTIRRPKVTAGEGCYAVCDEKGRLLSIGQVEFTPKRDESLMANFLRKELGRKPRIVSSGVCVVDKDQSTQRED